MGYNTTVVVLNDRLNEIEKDPEFGKKLSTAVRLFSRRNPERSPYVTGQTQVIEIDHSSYYQILVVGGNTGWPLHKAPTLPYGVLNSLADCLLRHGWRAAPPPKRRKKAEPLP